MVEWMIEALARSATTFMQVVMHLTQSPYFVTLITASVVYVVYGLIKKAKKASAS